jgi:hypothetical protein
MMTYLKNFLLFWYDFMVGDDWMIAAGVLMGDAGERRCHAGGLALAGDAPVAVTQLRSARRHLISWEHDGDVRRGRQRRSQGMSIITAVLTDVCTVV